MVLIFHPQESLLGVILILVIGGVISTINLMIC